MTVIEMAAYRKAKCGTTEERDEDVIYKWTCCVCKCFAYKLFEDIPKKCPVCRSYIDQIEVHEGDE